MCIHMYFLNISKTLPLNKFSAKFVLPNLLELFAISRVFDICHLIKICLVEVFTTDNDVLRTDVRLSKKL